MRRIYSISLVGVFIVNTMGLISILFFHHYQVHKYIESIIRTENHSVLLHQLKITSDESDKLIWYKDGHEFRYQGNMYDVVRTEIQNDGTTIYHCVKDEKENEIYRDFADDFNHTSPGQNQDRNLVLQLFKFLSNIFITLSSGTFTDVNEIQKSRFNYMDTFHPVYLSIICEPPDIV